MRGYPRYNFDAFEDAMKDLTRKGFDVVSPHKMDMDLGFNPDSGEYDDVFRDECVRRDVDALIRTEGAVFLPGWEKSVGARAERAVAEWLEHPCFAYPTMESI
jgi:hypothetical protein